MINPIVRGWMNYYGAFYPSALSTLLARINTYWCVGSARNTNGYGLSVKPKRDGNTSPRPIPATSLTGNR